jgi:tRNA (adenine22-N1)-methyltransferase
VSDVNKVKLGKRLTSIEMMVVGDYDHIWDCCCDHGLLGLQLLENGKTKHLHFVDIVAPLLSEIEHKLNRYYQGKSRWSVHCLDVAKLPLAEYRYEHKSEQKKEKHLIIIAGVGGQLLIDFLTSLLPYALVLNIEFILSPVHHNYQLRQFLREQHCGLIDEMIIEENNRFYEVMHIESPNIELQNVSNFQRVCISSVGSKMWNFENLDHKTYLQQTINHYQRMAKNPNIDVGEIIKAYLDLIPSV